mgnify:CR=1 FL=1
MPTIAILPEEHHGKWSVGGSRIDRELVVLPEAETEMAEAYDWYEARSPGLGSDFLLSVDAVLQAAMRNPGNFPLCTRKPSRTDKAFSLSGAVS